MQQSLSLFLAKSGISVVEDKSNGSKEITLSRTVSAHHDIVTGTEGLHQHLILVRFEPLNCKLKAKKEREKI